MAACFSFNSFLRILCFFFRFRFFTRSFCFNFRCLRNILKDLIDGAGGGVGGAGMTLGLAVLRFLYLTSG